MICLFNTFFMSLDYATKYNIITLAKQSLIKWNNPIALIRGKCAFCEDADLMCEDLEGGKTDECKLCYLDKILCDYYSNMPSLYKKITSPLNYMATMDVIIGTEGHNLVLMVLGELAENGEMSKRIIEEVNSFIGN